MKSKKKALTPEEKLSQALLPREEWPYELPKGWVWTRVESIAIKISDGSHNPPPNSFSGIPLLSAANVYDNKIHFDETNRWITEKQWVEENKRTNIEKNDVLLTIVGTMGRTAVVDSTAKFALQRSVAVIKPKLDAVYLSYYLSSPFVQIFMLNNANGTAQKGFYLNKVAKIKCPLPPLPEQQRIVGKIESLFAKLDEAGDRLQKVLDGYEARRAAILHEAFSGKWTGDSGEQSDIKRMPLKKCGVWHGGGTPSKSHPEYWANGSIMWITSKDMKTNVIDNSLICVNEKGIENSSAVYSDKPAVLFVMRSGVLRHTLPIAMVSKPYTVNQDLKALTPEEGILPEYIMWACKAEEKTILNQCMKSGTTVESINFQSLLNFQISVYPEKKQRYIVDRIHKALTSEESCINHISSVYTQIDLMKKSILARAFRGELGTQDSSDPSALELLKECVLAEKEVSKS